jgi:beta-lactamase class A
MGASAIVGTVLSLWPPVSTTRLVTKSKPAILARRLATPATVPPENPALKQKLQTLLAQYPQLQLHLSVLNLTSGQSLDLQGAKPISAASTIKIPILVALFQQLDQQQLQLAEKLTLEKPMIVGGNGDMADQPVGATFTVLESAVKMIADNDNTATNLLIKRLGGQEKLNAQFHAWGLVSTTMHSPLPDFAGANISSPIELTNLLRNLERGQLLSPSSRQQVWEILSKTKRNNLLPWGLKPATKIAHKTGEIPSLVADVGLIELSGQRKYVVAAMVRRPSDSDQAEELIRQTSKIIYQEYEQLPTAAPPP